MLYSVCRKEAQELQVKLIELRCQFSAQAEQLCKTTLVASQTEAALAGVKVGAVSIMQLMTQSNNTP